MTSTPHDALFKFVFEQPRQAAQLFERHLSETIREAVDWTTLKHEPGSFIDPELDDSETDVLLSAELRGERVFFYLLLEHQSTNDRWMAYRIAKYVFRILERYHREYPDQPLPLIFPLVVSHAAGGWTAPVWLHDLFRPAPASTDHADLILNVRYLIEDLAHLTDDDLRARAHDALVTITMALQRDARTPEALLRHVDLWADAYDALQRATNGLEAIALVLRGLPRGRDLRAVS